MCVCVFLRALLLGCFTGKQKGTSPFSIFIYFFWGGGPPYKEDEPAICLLPHLTQLVLQEAEAEAGDGEQVGHWSNLVVRRHPIPEVILCFFGWCGKPTTQYKLSAFDDRMGTAQ